MKLLDALTVTHRGGDRTIELYQGDLTAMPPDLAVDVLVVSANPGNYRPVRRTLIAALEAKGVSVAELAQAKAADYRTDYSCWLSAPISASDPGIRFGRILCFEPRQRLNAPQVVGGIFQGLMPLVNSETPITGIAMPLVSTGVMRVPVADMIEPLLDAAVHWLALGLPVKRLLIVEKDELKAAEVKGAFGVLKKRHEGAVVQATPEYRYDVFISYSHRDQASAEHLMAELRRLWPGVRVFFDRLEIDTGAAWQQRIFEALDDCNKVVALYSPDYLASKVCQEEFNIAWMRHRDSGDGVLLPIYLRSAGLPTYMKAIQFIDCRESDHDKLKAACRTIVAELKGE